MLMIKKKFFDIIVLIYDTWINCHIFIFHWTGAFIKMLQSPLRFHSVHRHHSILLFLNSSPLYMHGMCGIRTFSIFCYIPLLPGSVDCCVGFAWTLCKGAGYQYVDWGTTEIDLTQWAKLFHFKNTSNYLNMRLWLVVFQDFLLKM